MRRVAVVLAGSMAACAPVDNGPIPPAVEERLVQLETRVAQLETAREKRAAEPTQSEPLTGEVTLRIRTQPVAAKVVAARTGEVLGTTNSEEGVVMPMSNDPTDLILRADGYEELLFSIVPNRNKAFSKQLQRR